MRAIITGMHRSGTSTAMGTLGLCGLEIGNNFTRPRPANAKGYFEDREFRRINRSMLTADQAKGIFDSPLKVSINKTTSRDIESFLKTWEGKRSVGWKDPFASLTINIWEKHIHDLRVVICDRPYVEIAESLKARQGMEIEDGTKLAFSYMRTLYYHLFSKRYRFYFIKYHNLMTDWRGCLPELCNFLGLDRPKDEGKIDDFIDSDLWHQRQGIRIGND